MKNKKVIFFIVIAFMFGLIIFTHSCKKNKYEFNGNYTEIKDYKYVPLIKAKLEGKYEYFILDTGASISVIDKDKVKEYDLSYREEEGTVTGYGGTLNSHKILYRVNVELNGIMLRNDWSTQDLSSIKSAVRNNTGITIAGVIGNNQISRYNMIIDLNKGRLYTPKNVVYKEDSTMLIL